MNNTQIIKMLTATSESVKSAHKRIDKADRLARCISKLAVNVGTLSAEVKGLAAETAGVREGLKTQGERIGKLENAPDEKWKSLMGYVLCALISSGVGAIVINLI